MDYYCLVYKPFNVLTQFTSSDGKQTLQHYFHVPKDVYPLGRLDYDSEGLLILSNDKQLNAQLLLPRHQHHREYWVQVDGQITNEAIKQLEKGVVITINGEKYHTKPCQLMVFENAPIVPERNPPVRFRKSIPTSWIKILLTEGKNRQVRKMTAAVGFPTLRLIRYRIGKCTIDNLQPGDLIKLTRAEIYEMLFGSF